MKNFFRHALARIGIFAVISSVFGLAVMLLWNWLLPAVFNLPKIDYAQAIGLFVLTRVLFSGIGIIGGGFGGGRRGHEKFLFGNDTRYSNPFREKWLAMSEEERNEFWKHHHKHFW
jgi:hypothetical protein